MIPQTQLDHRFAYHPPTSDAVADEHSVIRGTLAGVASDWNRRLPDSREKSLALAKLEEAMMWANAAIARNQEAP